MYKNEESWEISCPANVIAAVRALRSTFGDAHRKVGTITEQLTYAMLHEEGIEGIKDNLPHLVQLKQIAGASATKRFNETVQIGTSPAVFRAFLNLYQDTLTAELLHTFEHLLEIGAVHTQDIKESYWDWAMRQCVHVIRSESYRIQLWVRNCCDRHDSLEINAAKWRNWQAPKLLTMTPAHTAPFETGRAWERLDSQDSQALLEHFETFYILHLEHFLKRAWETVTVRIAKQPLVTPVSSTDLSMPTNDGLRVRQAQMEDKGKRESFRQLLTQRKHKAWKSEYLKLKRHRVGKTDVWYAQQIAKLSIADGASSETIRKNMK